ncbi:hypothetical protein AK812_SmicGene8642 [Symbiodinium microadriaticum]|uniref:FCP1 homology domain-containing protein n=1 Tax=Symbiodinium microadriaticum TaxID=2951 RepID=A0A1Q9EKH8_SYMMI|nr:hypothetical protein AK812_SmicGene8642 [Symbiodinium microadriaticum]
MLNLAAPVQPPAPVADDPLPDGAGWNTPETKLKAPSSQKRLESWDSDSTMASTSPSPSASQSMTMSFEKQVKPKTLPQPCGQRGSDCKKLIFMDVDGVLHAANFAPTSFSKPCMEALAMIVRETGAQIILSSTWRLWDGSTGRKAVDKALKLHGIPKLAGQTPDLKGAVGRPNEILEYLKSCEGGPAKWIALDDMDMRAELGDRLVMTHATKGLRPRDARRAIALLNDWPLPDCDSDSDSDWSDDEDGAYSSDVSHRESF